MKITKFIHACMLVEEAGVRILIDPGNYSTEQNELENLHVVLITHEHQDHIAIESLKAIVSRNPQVKVMCNAAVSALLAKENIASTLLEHGQSANEQGVLIEGFGVDHALIHSSIPLVRNTGYMIAERFFYPGDAFTVPEKKVEILALPVAGPWATVGAAIDCALAIRPTTCIPVHDGMLTSPGAAHRVSEMVLTKNGIAFVEPTLGVPLEL